MYPVLLSWKESVLKTKTSYTHSKGKIKTNGNAQIKQHLFQLILQFSVILHIYEQLVMNGYQIKRWLLIILPQSFGHEMQVETTSCSKSMEIWVPEPN